MDAHRTLINLTLDIIGLSAFGYEFHAVEEAAAQDSLHRAYVQLFPAMSLGRVVREMLPEAARRVLCSRAMSTEEAAVRPQRWAGAGSR